MIVNKYKGGGSSSAVTPEQVQEQINSALTYYWESGITKEYVDSADTIIYASATSRMDDVEQVVSSALNECHEQIMELSARTPDLSNYYTSAQTENAISAATSGKADAANVTANTDSTKFPRWNKQGIVTGIQAQVFKNYLDVNDVGGPLTFYTNSTVYGTQERALKFYAPVSAGTAGEILVSVGSGAPVWSAVTFPADTKILVDFDKTPQSERAALYAELKALYDGGSGSSINKLYDFYKTVNTWQGQKIDYYTFSGNTLVFGQVVSPENVTDQVVYVQVMEIDSAGTVNVVTNVIGASGGGVTQEYVDSAITQVQDQLDLIDEVIPAAIVDLNERVDEISAATPSIDLSGYYTSAQTESAISAATADFINSGDVKTIIGNYTYLLPDLDAGKIRFFRYYQNGSSTPRVLGNPSINGEKIIDDSMGKNFVLPTSADVQTQIEGYNYVTSAQVETQIVEKNYITSADTANMVSSTSVSTIWKGTQAQYDAIITKDPNTFYIIVNE